jgi:hypothetical protein
MADRGANLGGLRAPGHPDRLNGSDRQRRERFDEGAAEGEIADVQRFERVHGTPELPDDLETRAHSAVS